MNYTNINNMVIELAPGVENISLGGFTTPNIRALPEHHILQFMENHSLEMQKAE